MKQNLNRGLKIILFFFASFIFISCVPIAQQGSGSYASKVLVYDNKVYEDAIKSVTLYPYTGSQRDLLLSTAIPLSQEVPLQLSFDELSSESKSYYLKVILCNSNWTPSPVSSIDYVERFNEILITDYDLSVATKVRYTNYRVTVPKVKIPGNYLIKVYRNKNEDDLILTRRFMVYTEQVRINTDIGFSNVVSFRDLNQQLNLSLNFGNFELVNPMENVKVLIRQNQRSDNQIYLKPSFIRLGTNTIEYNYFNLENNFSGGNEFRAFDIRSITFPGMNVAKIVNTPSLKEVFLQTDKPRSGQAYSLIPDINGKFIVDNYDFSSDSTSGSDYIDVNFRLQSPPLNQDVYIVGSLTNWSLEPENKMIYNQEEGRYEGTLLLKQGWYNYGYGVAGSKGRINLDLIEGARFETENEYEIFVYYRPVGSRTDLIIGYFYIDHNMRK